MKVAEIAIGHFLARIGTLLARSEKHPLPRAGSNRNERYCLPSRGFGPPFAAEARNHAKATESCQFQTDLINASAIEEITKAACDRFGHIDILVNNAGIGPGAIRPDSWQRPLKFWEITPDQWHRFVAVHTTAPLALTNAVVPEMMRQGWPLQRTDRPRRRSKR